MRTVHLVLMTGWLAAHALAAPLEGPPPQGGWNPAWGVVPGGGVAAAAGPDGDLVFAASVETTAFLRWRRPFYPWITAGLHMAAAPRVAWVAPSVTAGITAAVVAVGVGCDAWWTQDGWRAGLHALVEVPVWARPLPGRTAVFAAPYFRPGWVWTTDTYVWEVGLLIKWLWATHGP